MSNVVAFLPSPLAPFLGTWVRDPLSVARKVVKRGLGDDGFKLLWSRASIADVRQSLLDDPELAARYKTICAMGSGSRLTISSRLMVWEVDATPRAPAKLTNCPIVSSFAEGRKLIVHAPNGRTVSGYELRMKQSWLLVSERYSGGNAMILPKSPVFRYYRAEV